MGGVDSLCSAVFTRLLLEPGLTEVLGQIVGTSVVLHHTKVKITRSTCKICPMLFSIGG